MNERTKKLYEQATTWALDNYPPPVNTFMWEDLRNEKFAELIVKECEKVAKGGSWYYDAPSCGWRNPINFVCNEMKEHFGIEE